MLALPPLTLAASGWVIGLLAVGFVLTCLFMMLVILIQKPKGGGLSGAFGGAGGGSAQAAFGAKVGDVLTWLTVACFVLFILLGMGLTWTINPTVAQHKAEAAQAPTNQTVGDDDAADDAEPEDEQAEGEVPTVGDLDATLDAVQEAAGQTAPPEPATPADDDDAVLTDPPENADESESAEAPDSPEAPEAAENPETPAAEDAPTE
jgi:preprotein translocase subunit SecG